MKYKYNWTQTDKINSGPFIMSMYMFEIKCWQNIKFYMIHLTDKTSYQIRFLIVSGF
jgi:hypothetical protein